MREWDDISYWLYLPIYLPGVSQCAIFFMILHSLSHIIPILSLDIPVSFSGLTGWPGSTLGAWQGNGCKDGQWHWRKFGALMAG